MRRGKTEDALIEFSKKDNNCLHIKVKKLSPTAKAFLF